MIRKIFLPGMEREIHSVNLKNTRKPWKLMRHFLHLTMKACLPVIIEELSFQGSKIEKRVLMSLLRISFRSVFKKYLELSGKIPEERITGRRAGNTGDLLLPNLENIMKLSKLLITPSKPNMKTSLPRIYRGIALICLEKI